MGLDISKQSVVKNLKQQSVSKVVNVYSSINENQLKKHKRLLNSIANEKIGNYVWRKDIATIATNLIYYFAGIEHEYDLNKSIALCGSYGVGKSMLMRIFKSYLNRLPGYSGWHPNIFRIISIEDVIQAMGEDKPIFSELLYNQNIVAERPEKKPANLLINEFGFKYNGKNFGTDYQELIEMFIMKRYDIYQEHNKLTHVTMNFGTEELQDVFTEKIIDRFKEMFNIISLDGESFRK
jgi:DNA replication protein DnaC